jgi:hypothetical protein
MVKRSIGGKPAGLLFFLPFALFPFFPGPPRANGEVTKEYRPFFKE